LRTLSDDGKGAHVERRHALDPRRDRKEAPAVPRQHPQAREVLDQRDASFQQDRVGGTAQVGQRVDIERVDAGQPDP
jgi:hypothetical protein